MSVNKNELVNRLNKVSVKLQDQVVKIQELVQSILEESPSFPYMSGAELNLASASSDLVLENPESGKTPDEPIYSKYEQGSDQVIARDEAQPVDHLKFDRMLESLERLEKMLGTGHHQLDSVQRSSEEASLVEITALKGIEQPDQYRLSAKSDPLEQDLSVETLAKVSGESEDDKREVQAPSETALEQNDMAKEEAVQLDEATAYRNDRLLARRRRLAMRKERHALVKEASQSEVEVNTQVEISENSVAETVVAAVDEAPILTPRQARRLARLQRRERLNALNGDLNNEQSLEENRASTGNIQPNAEPKLDNPQPETVTKHEELAEIETSPAKPVTRKKITARQAQMIASRKGVATKSVEPAKPKKTTAEMKTLKLGTAESGDVVKLRKPRTKAKTAEKPASTEILINPTDVIEVSAPAKRGRKRASVDLTPSGEVQIDAKASRKPKAQEAAQKNLSSKEIAKKSRLRKADTEAAKTIETEVKSARTNVAKAKETSTDTRGKLPTKSRKPEKVAETKKPARRSSRSLGAKPDQDVLELVKPVRKVDSDPAILVLTNPLRK